MVGIKRRTRSGRRHLAITAIVGSLFLAAVPFASAQSGGASKLPDGEFEGVIGLTGGILITQPEGQVTFEQDWIGGIEFTMDDGTMDGEWLLTGESTVDGLFAAGGTDITIVGGGPIFGEGAVGGTPLNYKLTGEIEFDGSVTIDMGVTAQTAGGPETKPLDQALTDVIGICDRIIGRWDYELKQEAQFYELNESFRGYFTAWRDGVPPERSEEAETLISGINAWASAAARTEADGVDAIVADGLDLLDQAQQLQARPPTGDPCPDSKEYLTEMTLAAQDAIDAIIGRYPETVDPSLVALALATGAIGEGSPTPQAGDGLQGKMETAINDTYDSIRYDVFSNEAQAIGLATAAQMLGMETMGSSASPPGDVLLLVEGG